MSAPIIADTLNYAYNVCIHKSCFPKVFKTAKVIPIYKHGSKSDTSNYRPISVLSLLSKPLEKHIHKHMLKHLNENKLFHPNQSSFREDYSCQTEHLLSDAQFGFRKGRGCTDAIYALRQLCERAIEHDQDLHLVFVDQEKAFDRVNRDKLWKVLEQYGVRGQLLDNI